MNFRRKWKLINIAAAILIAIIISIMLLLTQFNKVYISKINLTIEEKKWLDAHSEIKLAPDPNFPPIEFFENNLYKGLIADYFNLIEKRLNKKFKIVQLPSWDAVIEAAKNREIDGITAAQITPERIRYLLYTDSIIDIPNVIISRLDLQPGISLAELSGKKITITSGNALHEFISTNYPEIIIIPVKDDLTALNNVSFHQADATIVNLAIASYLIEENGITNLHIIGDSGKPNPLAIAIRNDYPILISILNKALNTISNNERNQINERWIKLKLDKFLLSKDFWITASIILLCIIIVFTGILIWNYKLIKQVKKKTNELNNELTIRMRSEEELRKSEERFKEIIELAVDAIVLGSPIGIIIGANSRACQMTGYSTAELMGQNIKIFFEENELNEKPLRYDLLKKGDVVRTERRLKRKDGSEIIVEMNTKMMPDSTYQSFIRDITERKKTELHLMDVNTKLLTLINELKSLDEMKTNILANVSHELRTPLVSIRGYVELINAGKFGEVNKIQQNYFYKIMNNVDRLVKIIEDLIMFSRMEKGKEKLNYTHFNICEIIKEAVSIVYPSILEKKINIQGNHQTESFFIDGDKDKILQVVINLLMNAIKFTNENGNIEILVSLIEDSKKLSVSIKDDGIGIPENLKNKIFDKFYQIDASPTRQHGGLGLGLSICKSITELHKGKIYAETLDKGSMFTVILPVSC